jgi:hypothetical protein
MFDLRDIIHLHPVREPKCAGFAPSKGRRCTKPTNAANRSTAGRLLDLGSKQLLSGQSVDDVLDELAPCVLCRWHKDQTKTMATEWKSRVSQFWLGQAQALAATSPPRSTTSSSSRRPPSFEAAQRLDSLQTSIPSTASNSHNSRHRRKETSHSAANSSSPPRSPSTASALPERSNSPSNTSSTLSREDEEPTSDPAAVTAPREHSRRRPVEGDCNICIEPLTRRNERDSTSRIDGNESRELVWCERLCGLNFHKTCMDSWIAQPRENDRPASCPICRVNWQA